MDPTSFPAWMQGNRYEPDFFTYVVPLTTGGLGGTGLATATAWVTNLLIQSEAVFEWQATTWYANEHGAAVPQASGILVPVSLQIQDAGTSRLLFSAPTPISSIAGDGKQPMILPQSRFFKPNSNVQVTAYNFDANTWDNITVNLIGTKWFLVG